MTPRSHHASFAAKVIDDQTLACPVPDTMELDQWPNQTVSVSSGNTVDEFISSMKPSSCATLLCFPRTIELDEYTAHPRTNDTGILLSLNGVLEVVTFSKSSDPDALLWYQKTAHHAPSVGESTSMLTQSSNANGSLGQEYV